ncbi:MAG TPA: hypothetical protein VF758_02600, partial [Candidatus Acidoferrum sp.]
IWKNATALTHPNLLRILDQGRCQFAETNTLYVVMEFADEDLSQVIPQRALSAEETRDMLDPLLDALVYLHGHGLAHAHIKPSNILAAGDRLKLSCDTAAPFGELPAGYRERDIYDEPDASGAPLSASSDVWALGATLMEVLTQHLPELPAEAAADPGVPDTIPQPYLDVLRHALRRNPGRRWTMGEIAARLNPAPAATAAAPPAKLQDVLPVNVPLSPEPAVPLAKLPQARPKPMPAQRTPSARKTVVLPNYVVPLLLGAAVVVMGIFAIPQLLKYRMTSPVSPAGTNATASPHAPAAPAKSVEAARPASVPTSASGASANASRTVQDHKATQSAAPKNSVNSAPATLRAETFNGAATAKPSAARPGRGEVLEQVLPDVPEKARTTIQGTVHVGVKAKVSPSGTVSATELTEPGPSKYFARLAEEAALRWEFISPEVEGRSLPSEWLIRFEFSQAGTHALATQTAP